MKKTITPAIALLTFMALFALPGYSAEAIQTQPSSDGNFEASLMPIEIRRDVLTVKAIVKNISSKEAKAYVEYSQAYYTDIENKRKYFILKDSEGQFIAGPKSSPYEGGLFSYSIAPGEQKIVWMKFPAPPEPTTAVDIFIPGILPFEEVALTR